MKQAYLFSPIYTLIYKKILQNVLFKIYLIIPLN